jgi:hypothetical protein
MVKSDWTQHPSLHFHTSGIWRFQGKEKWIDSQQSQFYITPSEISTGMKKSDWTASIPVSIPLGHPWVVKIGLTAGIPVPFSYLWDLRISMGMKMGERVSQFHFHTSGIWRDLGGRKID